MVRIVAIVTIPPHCPTGAGEKEEIPLVPSSCVIITYILYIREWWYPGCETIDIYGGGCSSSSGGGFLTAMIDVLYCRGCVLRATQSIASDYFIPSPVG